MHVDGFRFDLASILARDASGQPLPNPPVLWDIESDPVLAGTKLIKPGDNFATALKSVVRVCPENAFLGNRRISLGRNLSYSC